MNKNLKTAIIAGGGTGGHLFPALAIGEKLKEKNIIVKYIGSKHGIEKKLFRKLCLDYHLINITGIQRNFSIKAIIKNLFFPVRFIIAYCQSLLIIYKTKPSIIIGTGGYSSGLPLIAAIHMKIPTLIQDQNSIPGIITKKLNKKVNKICLAYDIASKHLTFKNYIITGNPISSKMKSIDKSLAQSIFNLSNDKKTILILGGSQGARPINYHILINIEFYLKENYQILWQCGNNDYEFIKTKVNNKNIVLLPFIVNMAAAYSIADIVVSRAGAITISELLFFNKAMVLIPYPKAAENHQKLNAKFIEEHHACILIEQDQLDKGILEKNIHHLFINQEELENLKKATNSITKINATEDIVNQILALI